MQTQANTHTAPVPVATVIDPTTREGFVEIANTFGRDAAHEARINALRARLENGAFIRWHDLRIQRAISAAVFERDWEAANPVEAQLLRDAGVSY